MEGFMYASFIFVFFIGFVQGAAVHRRKTIADLKSVRTKLAAATAAMQGLVTVNKRHAEAHTVLAEALLECPGVCEVYAKRNQDQDQGSEPPEHVMKEQWFTDIERGNMASAAEDCGMQVAAHAGAALRRASAALAGAPPPR